MTVIEPNDDQLQREFALDVVKKLRSAGHQALWAGGCVRDQLLGLAPKDYDVATSALPDEVRNLFGRRRTLAIGASFGVITVLGAKGRQPIEVATFRTDGDYRDGRRPEHVEFADARRDAERRDFTINGLFFDPVAGEVVDYVDGAADLDAGVVRAIGNPLERFAEDKLRMLRAVRFAAAFEFSIAPDTLAAIRSMADDVTVVSAERIGAELQRILTARTRRRGMELLADAHLLRPVLPELAALATDGGQPWQAILERLDRLTVDTLSAALATLLFEVVDHQAVRDVGRRLRFSNKVIDRAAWLVKNSPRIMRAATLSWPKLQRILAHEGSGELVSIAEAILPADDAGLKRCREVLMQPPAQWNPPPLVTGDDILRRGLHPGRHFAALLDHLRDLQLTAAITTPEDALAEAERWIQNTDGR